MKKIISALCLSAFTFSGFAAELKIESAYDVLQDWPERGPGDHGLVSFSKNEFNERTGLTQEFSQEDAANFILTSLQQAGISVTRDELLSGQLDHVLVKGKLEAKKLEDGFALYQIGQFDDVVWYASIDNAKNVVSVYVDVDYSEISFSAGSMRQNDEWVVLCFFEGELSGMCSRQYDGG